jgi:8-oxo-dGTP pyrophosphatase MutT (NUDIX family)
MITLNENQIINKLKDADKLPLDAEEASFKEFLIGEPIPAAVLIPLLIEEGEWRLLLTRRKYDLAEHSGQVAFPGGRADPADDTPVRTALREACEEIGLLPDDVRILGRLRKFHTVTNYLVTPVVGIIPWPYPLQISNEEVSRVFTIPLNWLADPKNMQVEKRELPPPYPPVSVIYYHPYDGEVLWGASARITQSFLNILTTNSVVAT